MGEYLMGWVRTEGKEEHKGRRSTKETMVDNETHAECMRIFASFMLLRNSAGVHMGGS